MKKTLYILLAAVAVISCTKAQTTVSPDQEILEPQGKIVSFTVTAIKDESTRATLNTTDRCIEWEDDDINDAKLFNSAFKSTTGEKPSSFEVSSDKKSATITYEVELKDGVQMASDTFWFIFGAEGEILNGGKENESINYVLPTTVNGAKAQPVMVGVCETTDHNSLSFNLQLAAAYAKIGIKPDEPSASLSKAEIFGADATTYIAGTCSFAKNGTITPVSSGSTDYCHISATNLDGAKEFYVNLNPRNNSTTTTDLTLILFNPSGQAMMRDLNENTLAHSINLTSSSYHEFIYGSFKPITITSTISATTTYSQYSAGQVTQANNTDNTYKIWDITASKTVTGIPASSSRLNDFIKQSGIFLDTNTQPLSGNSVSDQSVGKHTLTVNYTFDYLGHSILLSTNSIDAYVTGLPYTAAPPRKDGNFSWTKSSGQTGYDQWTDNYVSIGTVTSGAPEITSSKFYIPTNEGIQINAQCVYTKNKKTTFSQTFYFCIGGNSTTKNAGNVIGKSSTTSAQSNIKISGDVTMTQSNNFFRCLYDYGAANSDYVRVISVTATYKN